ncbi:6-phosphogluconolactonase [Dactylosporangium sp. CA-052675]|uniref:6-phosphogluconolactonase n=1 Tax=Dactylosporangium sp. CA-052675 TaxID=3239927 RepID=UPI003D912D7B
MSQSKIIVHTEPRLLAEAAAARLIVRLTDAQAERGEATVALTGGRIAAQIYQAVRESPARDAVDWSRVNVWWGDERFLPSGDGERNETQARAALLDALRLDPARVHPMPASDGPDGDDAEAAAARYAGALAEAARPGHAELPHFDVVLLGVGEDGHVASVFPEHPVTLESRPVSAVRGSPKPPPVRTTLTLPAINTAAEVWLIASGDGKAKAVGLALADAGPRQIPAAGVHGRELTLWLLDTAAAHELPPRFRSLV